MKLQREYEVCDDCHLERGPNPYALGVDWTPGTPQQYCTRGFSRREVDEADSLRGCQYRAELYKIDHLEDKTAQLLLRLHRHTRAGACTCFAFPSHTSWCGRRGVDHMLRQLLLAFDPRDYQTLLKEAK